MDQSSLNFQNCEEFWPAWCDVTSDLPSHSICVHSADQPICEAFVELHPVHGLHTMCLVRSGAQLFGSWDDTQQVLQDSRTWKNQSEPPINYSIVWLGEDRCEI